MDELSIEQKAKAYDKALERARNLHKDAIDMGDNIRAKQCEIIFPELRESKDDRIMRVIRGWIYTRPASFFDNGISKEEILAWLEKQGENFTKKDVDDAYLKGLCDTKHELGKQGGQKPIISNDALREGIVHFGITQYQIDNWLKKYVDIEEQGEPKQDPCENCKDKCLNCRNFPCIDKREFERGKSALEAIKEEKVNNQKCVKSVYNVEPKFKVGDWISNDMCDVHIASIEDGMYYFDEGDGLSIVFVDEHYHIWTIEDAMDGDVLAFKNNSGIIICKSPTNYDTRSYCRLIYDNFINKEESGWDSTLLVPATKEQRDTLFAKMKEAGYTFDFKKKELKKLGQPEVTKTSDQEEITEIPFGAKDSELQEATYFIPKGFHAEIDDDKVVIKKGEKPAAWSEEDERLCLCLIEEQKEALNNVKNDKYGHSEIISDLKEMYNERISWLKSLKQRIGG